MALALQGGKHPAGVTAVAQGGIVAYLAGLDLQNFQDLLHHNGNVHTRRGLALGDDLVHIFPVFFGIQFLIFVFKPPGMGAFVPGSAFVLLLFHGDRSFLFALG